MLRKVGVKAYPVLISTTSNGKVFPFRVSPNEFDRVISAIEMEDSTLLLVDAADFPNPVGLLGSEDLNGEGLLLKSQEEIEWIPLQNKVSVNTALIANWELNEKGGIKGNIVYFENGYDAVDNRRAIKEKGNEVLLKEKFKTWVADGTFSDIKVENAEDWQSAGTKLTFNMETSVLANASGDKIYLSPLIGLGIHDNPFKNPDRKFNVDFGPPNEENINLAFKIPQGYRVEEAPKPMKMSFGENGLNFDYLIDIKADMLKIVVRTRQKASTINVSEYAQLQEFYSKMVAKMEEQVVLSKL